MDYLDSTCIDSILSKRVDSTVTSFEDLPKTSSFKDVVGATTLFIDSLANNKRICIIHDSDCDGISTYSLSTEFIHILEQFDKELNIDLVITKRSEGYGLLPKHITDHYLYITADNGITSFDACVYAKKESKKVIITDHHQVDCDRGCPNADFIINPHQSDCPSKFKDISGTVVYWFFLRNILDTLHIPYDKTGFGSELLMLSTISDVMPLINMNRFFVKHGLSTFKTSRSRWVKTYLEHDPKTPTAEGLAFGLIPMINATGRLTDATEAAKFLVETDRNISIEWFEYLIKLNNHRKLLQENLIETINTKYSSWLNNNIILIPGLKEHGFIKGILGPVASRFAEKYNCPTIIMLDNGTYVSGSGRSVSGIDLLGLMKQNTFIDSNKTGGHPMACGVTIDSNIFNNFYHQAQTDVSEIRKDIVAEVDIKFNNLLSNNVIGSLCIGLIDFSVFDIIHKYEPYGNGHPRPLFLISNCSVKNIRKIGKLRNHMSLQITDGVVNHNASYFFYDIELDQSNKYDIIYSIEEDTFRGNKKIVIFIKAIRTHLEYNNNELPWG